MAGADDAGFLSRWSQRKALVRGGSVPPEPATPPAAVEPAPAAVLVPPPAPAEPAQAAAPPPPTLADVALLGRESDYSRFVAPGVDLGVKNAALKKLFTDPHFNVMDRLDTYIDDYGQPDPLPEGMLRQMAQAQFLGLFRDEEPATTALPGPLPEPPPDEDTDLRLQSHAAAGPSGADAGAGPDPGRQH